jgi:hypothetical protein
MLDMPLNAKETVKTFLPWHVKLFSVKKTKASQITLQEHLQSIAALGGRARAEQLAPEQQSDIGRKAGLVGGVARAKKLSPAKRKAIAKKAAEARWRDKKNDEKAAGEKGKAK